MIFFKSVSAGNDFLHIEAGAVAAAAKADLVKRLCDRNSGAGADGIVFYRIRDNKEYVDFEIYNRDGSEAELSGNGMAGLSALLFYEGKFADRVVLATKAGSKTHELLEKKGNAFRLRIEIGKADFSEKVFFPFLQPGKNKYCHEGVDFYPVSVGNPHVVVLLDKELPRQEMIEMGKMLENAAIFPHKTNVEFVLPPGSNAGLPEAVENCRVFYYERGVGETQSSATGSAAVFAVLQESGFVKDSLVIDTPREKVKIFAKKRIYIENFTKIVYKGVYLNS